MDSPRSDWLTVPNLLSLGRILATPILFWLIVTDQRLASGLLVGVMGITDFLDGYIARHTGQVSDLGVLLDPISDRLAVMATIVALLVAGTLPLWLGLPVLIRDALLSIIFLGLARAGFGNPQVKFIGKAATFTLLASLPALVFGGPPANPIFLLRLLGLLAFGVGAVLYFIAAAAYAVDIRHWLATRRGSLENGPAR